MKKIIYSKTLTGAGMWSQVIRRGRVLKLTTKGEGANVGMLLYNGLERTERYNMPDTLKGQQVFYLTEGSIELAKWGLDERSLVPNLNWFSKGASSRGQ